MKNKYKIAVCLSGEVRYWDVANQFFEYWNELHRLDRFNAFGELSFDFFISTWNRNIENVVELNSLKSYEFLDEDIEFDFIDANQKYWYLTYRSNLLKTEYELKNNLNYDLVISTRPDILIYSDTIHKLYTLCSHPNGIENRGFELFVLNGGCDPGINNKYYGFSMNDTFAAGTSATMDIYTSLYKYIYMTDDYVLPKKPKQVKPNAHEVVPYYMRYSGLIQTNRSVFPYHNMKNFITFGSGKYNGTQYKKIKNDIKNRGVPGVFQSH
jgi:hypothetical protein